MQLISRQNTIEDLVRFVKFYVREQKGEYKIPKAKIPDYLPHELKVIYHEFGNFPSSRQPATRNPTLPLDGNDTSHLFHNQDALVYFQDLRPEGDRVVFAWENQGNWSAETEINRDDPPVYSDAYLNWSADTGLGKIEVCHQLSHFLATFCLHELVFGSKHLYSIKETFDEEGFKRVIEKSTAVWLDGEYVWRDNQLSYYLIEDNLLLMVVDGIPAWVASNEDYDNIAHSESLRDIPRWKHAL